MGNGFRKWISRTGVELWNDSMAYIGLGTLTYVPIRPVFESRHGWQSWNDFLWLKKVFLMKRLSMLVGIEILDRNE